MHHAGWLAKKQQQKNTLINDVDLIDKKGR